MNPLISIIIATYNSESRLQMVLDSIIKQDVAEGTYEVLLVDGRSSDRTREFEKIYSFLRVIDNPKIDPVNAKYIGYKEAKGKILVYLDHDEVFQSVSSLRKRMFLAESLDTVALCPTGYANPPGYSFINQYINSFGDPFSAFHYSLTKDHRFFISEMKKKYDLKEEDKNIAIFNFNNATKLPIIELCAMAATIKKEFLDSLNIGAFDLPLAFLFLCKKNKNLGILKEDPISHYSSDTYTNYLSKIKWRIRNNIFQTEEIGQSGFSGREKGSDTKKYLFIPYNILILPVFIHSILYCIMFRNIKYMIHFPLSIYTCYMILYYYAMKLLNIKPTFKNYDGTSKVSKQQ